MGAYGQELNAPNTLDMTPGLLYLSCFTCVQGSDDIGRSQQDMRVSDGNEKWIWVTNKAEAGVVAVAATVLRAAVVVVLASRPPASLIFRSPHRCLGKVAAIDVHQHKPLPPST